MFFQILKIDLDLAKLYFGQMFGIEVYLYTSGNVVIPRDSSGAYGSSILKFNKPKENFSIHEKFFVYKNVLKPLVITGLGCTENEAEDSVGKCIVKRVEEKHNCTTYQLFANKNRDICERIPDVKSRIMLKKLSSLSTGDIYDLYGCLPHCEHDEIHVKRIGSPFYEYKGSNPRFTLELQFEDGSYHTTEEYIIYDTDSFIADIGGYLGLLLGHSILSIYSTLVGMLDKSKTCQNKSCCINLKVPCKQ